MTDASGVPEIVGGPFEAGGGEPEGGAELGGGGAETPATAGSSSPPPQEDSKEQEAARPTSHEVRRCALIILDVPARVDANCSRHNATRQRVSEDRHARTLEDSLVTR